MHRKSLEHLIVFITVAREQSFALAATKLGISRPAVSQTITKSERDFGVRPITRTNRSVFTKDKGQQILEKSAHCWIRSLPILWPLHLAA
jgi:DNA-binding transcriptional LysR family regulator